MSGHGQGSSEDKIPRKNSPDELGLELQELQEIFSQNDQGKKQKTPLILTAQAESGSISKEESDVSQEEANTESLSHSDSLPKVIESSEEFIRTNSTSSLDLYRPSEEIDKLVGNIDDHLQDFLEEALSEFRTKSSERRSWSIKVWWFTIALVVWTFILIIGNFFVSNYGISKPIITEKLLYIFVGGMFAQILSLMLIIMKYVFSPSKDVYSYLTELVKVRKLKNGYDNSNENSNAS